jgi:hypothetical protein
MQKGDQVLKERQMPWTWRPFPNPTWQPRVCICLALIIRPKGPAPKGLEDSAQGFNPGNQPIKRFALTRHMNVRSMKNTRSSGLEMLKGR